MVLIIKNLIEKLKNHFLEVIRLKTSPNSIALGFATGTFILILPTPGFSILIGLAILSIFSRLNKFALLSSFLVWNPFVMLALYPVIYKVGNTLLGDIPSQTINFHVWDHIYHFTLRYVVGSFVVASFFAVLSYVLIRIIIYAYTKIKK